MVVNDGGTEISQKLKNALETTDRTSIEFISAINLTRRLSESFENIKDIVEKSVGYSETSEMVPSILSVVENMLISYIDMISSDYHETFTRISSDRHFTLSQTMSLRGLYLKHQKSVKETFEYILQYMSQMEISTSDALDRNNMDLVSLIECYNETVVALFQYTKNVENRYMPFPDAEIIPVTSYSSASYKVKCYSAIETTLKTLERVRFALNTTSGQFAYSDVIALTVMEDDCFGDYLAVAANLTERLLQATIDRYQKQIYGVLHQLKSFDIRGLLTNIVQLQMDLDYVIGHYVRKHVSKLDLALELQYFADASSIEFDNIINTVSADILQPLKNLIEQIETSLGNDYDLYFGSITQIKPFYDNSILYRLASSMRIWFRPIINAVGDLVTIRKSQFLGDVYRYVSVDEILPDNASNLTKEYIKAAFEHPTEMIRSIEYELGVLSEEMTQTLRTILENTATYIRLAEMNEEFVK